MDLVTTSGWTPFVVESQSFITFKKFIDKIVTIDESNPDQWVKWKNYAHQVVIETPNYFYKLYQTDIQNGDFICDIRETLARIYREEFRVDWNILTFQANNSYYQIEQREKLEVCSGTSISFEELFLNWAHTLEVLERELQLYTITLQLREYIPSIRKLKLVRDCVNKHSDYGMKNGHVILLDDADWFLALVDENNNWISHNFNVYPIIDRSKEKIFGPLDLYDRDPVAASEERVTRWSIFRDISSNKEKFVPNLLSIREQMLDDNIHILCEKNLNILENRDIKKLYTENEGIPPKLELL